MARVFPYLTSARIRAVTVDTGISLVLTDSRDLIYLEMFKYAAVASYISLASDFSVWPSLVRHKLTYSTLA